MKANLSPIFSPKLPVIFLNSIKFPRSENERQFIFACQHFWHFYSVQKIKGNISVNMHKTITDLRVVPIADTLIILCPKFVETH